MNVYVNISFILKLYLALNRDMYIWNMGKKCKI